MHFAAALGAHFSVLGVSDSSRKSGERQVEQYRVETNLVSHHAIKIAVLDLLADQHRTIAAFKVAALAAFSGGADTLVLGFAGLARFVECLQVKLRDRAASSGVMEPLLITLAFAGVMLGARAFPSERIYLKE